MQLPSRRLLPIFTALGLIGALALAALILFPSETPSQNDPTAPPFNLDESQLTQIIASGGCILYPRPEARGGLTVFASADTSVQQWLAFPWTVVALGRTADDVWWQVNINNFTGWLRQEMVRTQGPCDTLPVVNPADFEPVPTPSRTDDCWMMVYTSFDPYGDGDVIGTNLYADPESYEPFDALRTREEVRGLAYNAFYDQFQIEREDGTTGWINARHVTANALCERIPRPVQPTATIPPTESFPPTATYPPFITPEMLQPTPLPTQCILRDNNWHRGAPVRAYSDLSTGSHEIAFMSRVEVIGEADTDPVWYLAQIGEDVRGWVRGVDGRRNPA